MAPMLNVILPLRIGGMPGLPGRNINVPLPLHNNRRLINSPLPVSVLLEKKKDTTHDVKPVMRASMAVDHSSASSSIVEEKQGLGIVKLLEGKSLFITGSTGFLAKALVETILRTVPNVGKIYLLIRANNAEAAALRLKNEVINTDIFKSLQERHGESYESFMLTKLIPVAGNVCETDLGLDEDSTAMLAQQVDIIINSAGDTSFNQRYDVSINTNTRGPLHVMSFAKKCKNLQTFLHVSTAYVTRQNEGIVPEKLMGIGSSVTTNGAHPEPDAFTLLPNDLDIQEEINLALSSVEQGDGNGNNHSTTSKMRELGLRRAKKYGWHNTYSFTKAMGEALLTSRKESIPLLIIRPTIIEGAIGGPLRGWIEGNRMIDPIMTLYGKGTIPGFIGDPNTIVDIIPVDMVVNAMVAIIANQLRRLEERNKMTAAVVYHVGSSSTNQITLRSLVNMFHKYFSENSLFDSNGISIQVNPFKLYDSIHIFNADVWAHQTTIRQQSPTCSTLSYQTSATRSINSHVTKDSSPSKKIKLSKRLTEEIGNIACLYEPYVFYYGRFDDNNTQSIIVRMSNEERKVFYFDTMTIDWEDYYVNIHSPGLRKHVIKDQIS